MILLIYRRRMFFNIFFIALILMSVQLSEHQVRAQSRCTSTCSGSPNCASGLCTLQSCSDSGTCYEYCFNCSGVVTCYAQGYGCSFNSSTNLKQSMAFLTAAAGLSYWFYRHIQILDDKGKTPTTIQLYKKEL